MLSVNKSFERLSLKKKKMKKKKKIAGTVLTNKPKPGVGEGGQQLEIHDQSYR